MFCEAVSLDGAKSARVGSPRGSTGAAQVGGGRVCRRLTKAQLLPPPPRRECLGWEVATQHSHSGKIRVLVCCLKAPKERSFSNTSLPEIAFTWRCLLRPWRPCWPKKQSISGASGPAVDRKESGELSGCPGEMPSPSSGHWTRKWSPWFSVCVH